MRALGERAESECRVYFTDGTSAVLEGWRHTTVDVDMLLVADSDRLLQQVPELKEQLHLNVELASPAHFIPELPGWDRRSPFIERSGRVSFCHYDFYAQALAKVERGEERDLLDVRAILDRGLVTRALLWQHFRAIEPVLYRFPAIHGPAFRGALVAAIGPAPAAAGLA
jgi:hypothetical protein